MKTNPKVFTLNLDNLEDFNVIYSTVIPVHFRGQSSGQSTSRSINDFVKKVKKINTTINKVINKSGLMIY